MGSGMSDAHDSVDGLREVCHDIRQPMAGVRVLGEADLPQHTRRWRPGWEVGAGATCAV